MLRFGLIGAAGFVAPRHMRAIQDIGGELMVALDPHDSVGILDKYAPGCAFFTEPERFWRWMAIREFAEETRPDWISICSPNWMHDAHVRMALNAGCSVILEKPAVLSVRNLEAMLHEYGSDDVYLVHQLRWHPEAIRLKALVDETLQKKPDYHFDITLHYCTPRGPWYQYSWKGTPDRSGGPISNLGIHFLDLLCWIFGKHLGVEVQHQDPFSVKGSVDYPNASVWFHLSTRLRDSNRGSAIRQFCFVNENTSWDFSGDFNDLHTAVYKSAMLGAGVSLVEALDPIAIAEKIRNS